MTAMKPRSNQLQNADIRGPVAFLNWRQSDRSFIVSIRLVFGIHVSWYTKFILDQDERGTLSAVFWLGKITKQYCLHSSSDRRLPMITSVLSVLILITVIIILFFIFQHLHNKFTVFSRQGLDGSRNEPLLFNFLHCFRAVSLFFGFLVKRTSLIQIKFVNMFPVWSWTSVRRTAVIIWLIPSHPCVDEHWFSRLSSTSE